MMTIAVIPCSETTHLHPIVVRMIAFIRMAEILKRKRKKSTLPDKHRNKNTTSKNMATKTRYPRRTSCPSLKILKETWTKSGGAGENINLIPETWLLQSRTWTEIGHSTSYHQLCSIRMRSKCRGDITLSNQGHSKIIVSHNADPQISSTRRMSISQNRLISLTANLLIRLPVSTQCQWQKTRQILCQLILQMRVKRCPVKHLLAILVWI